MPLDGNYIISFLGPWASGLRLNYANGFPWSPAYRQQTVGLSASKMCEPTPHHTSLAIDTDINIDMDMDIDINVDLIGSLSLENADNHLFF